MYYVDVHCHLTGDEFDAQGGVEQILKNAFDTGVRLIVCSGYDLDSSMRAQEIAEAHEGVYFCAGFHPSELDKYHDGDLAKIERMLAHEKCVAVGEIGLDYHFEDNPPKETQKRLFIEQLALADKAGLPVVLHSRDAAQDTLEILEQNKSLLKRGGLMHCYSYSAEMAERFLALGLCFSFGGPCTFKNANKVQESVRRIPVCRILSETDCPYLTPVPKRGEFPNQPSNVIYVTQMLANLKETTLDEMQAQIVQNTKELFFKLQ